MLDQERELLKTGVLRLRSAAIMTDYQMERAARETAGNRGNHVLLAEFPEMREILPWIKTAA